VSREVIMWRGRGRNESSQVNFLLEVAGTGPCESRSKHSIQTTIQLNNKKVKGLFATKKSNKYKTTMR
jgi:hypothetical protein